MAPGCLFRRAFCQSSSVAWWRERRRWWLATPTRRTLPWVPPSVLSRPASSWTTSRVLAQRWDFGVHFSGSLRSGVDFAFDAGLFQWHGLGFFSQSQAFSAVSYHACAAPVCSHLHSFVSYFFFPVGNLARLTQLGHSSRKSSATHSCQCMQCFRVFKQCLGFLMYAKMLMHATAQWGCPDTVRESAMEVDSGRKIPCSAWDSAYMCVCVCVCVCVFVCVRT